jgi:disulfide bond formation protein DsbB
MISAAMLATAHASERFWHFYPCNLCLRQREVYWVAIGVALSVLVLAGMLSRSQPSRVLRFGAALLGVVFIAGAGIAGYHSLVEWGFVAAPPGCAAAKSADIPSAADIMAALSQPMATASCTEAPFRIMGLSMAGYNALASLALAAVSFGIALANNNKQKG